VVDMYGASQSPLHSAVGTDRLVVECVTTPESNGARGIIVDANGASVFTPFPRESDRLPAGDMPRLALIEVPRDLQAVVARSGTTAREWRAATRNYFQWAFAHGYGVTGVHIDEVAGRVFFVIERE
jgi:predicted GNAT superfamily acetyltransferase